MFFNTLRAYIPPKKLHTYLGEPYTNINVVLGSYGILTQVYKDSFIVRYSQSIDILPSTTLLFKVYPGHHFAD